MAPRLKPRRYGIDPYLSLAAGSSYPVPTPPRPLDTTLNPGFQGLNLGGVPAIPASVGRGVSPTSQPPPVAKPFTFADAQARAQGQIDPLLKQASDYATQQSRGARDALTGFYQALSGQLGKIDYGAPYEAAQGRQASVDEALRSSLAGEGAQASQELSGKLGGQLGPGGASAVAEVANQINRQGQGSGNQVLTEGSAALSQLISQGSAAEEYGAKQPGIATLAGGQNLRDILARIGSDASQQRLSLSSQIPGLTQDIYGTELGRRESELGRRERASAAAEDKRRFGISTATQKSQFEATTAENKRQFNRGLIEGQLDRAQDNDQFGATMAWQKVLAAYDRADDKIKNKLAAISIAGYDPETGGLTKAAAKAIQKLVGLDLTGGVSEDAALAKAKAAADKAEDDRGYALDVAKLNADILDAQARLKVSQQNADTASAAEERQRVKDLNALRAAKKKAPEVDLDLSIIRKAWVDSSGHRIPSLAKLDPPPKYKPGTKPAGKSDKNKPGVGTDVP